MIKGHKIYTSRGVAVLCVLLQIYREVSIDFWIHSRIKPYVLYQESSVELSREVMHHRIYVTSESLDLSHLVLMASYSMNTVAKVSNSSHVSNQRHYTTNCSRKFIFLIKFQSKWGTIAIKTFDNRCDSRWYWSFCHELNNNITK